MAKNSEDLSFFEFQTQMIGFDPKVDIGYYYLHPDEPIGKKKTPQPLYWEDEVGNVCIGLLGIDGLLMTYDDKESHGRISYKPMCIKRLKKPFDNKKYLPEKTGWGTIPYLTPGVLNEFKKRNSVKTLFIVEGQKKAFAMYKFLGLNVIGIPGINQWKQKADNDIYFAIKEIVNFCKVKEIVFLTDADTFKVEWKDGKDLYKRPFNFYTSLRIFKEVTRDFNIECYHSCIFPDHEKNGKGIDDLLWYYKEEKTIWDRIKSELNSISGDRIYISKFKISEKSDQVLKNYFHIKNPHNPQEFYSFYENELSTNVFIYNNSEYKYDPIEGKIDCLRNKENDQFFMIHDKFYSQKTKPVQGDPGRLEYMIKPISDKGIKTKLGNNKFKWDLLLKSIAYYDGAIVNPSHTNFEKEVIVENEEGIKYKWYNLYTKVTHVPTEGTCENSIAMIKHIFGEDELTYIDRATGQPVNIKSFDLGLDYIKLLWESPKQMLPILVLASEDRETGKTTFWNWLSAILQANAVKIKGKDLSENFSAYHALALLLVIEEAFFDKQQTMEDLKEIVTSETIRYEEKFGLAEKMEAFMKVGISTNNSKTFAKIDLKENRFWIRNIKAFPADKQDIGMKAKLIEEIPAFLNYIQERPFSTKNTTRFWFDYSLIETDELKMIKKESRWSYEKTLEEAIKEHMSSVGKAIIKLAKKDIKELTPTEKVDFTLMRKVLEDKWNLKPTDYSVPYATYKVELKYLGTEPEYEIKPEDRKGIVYTFTIDKFFNPDEYCHFLDKNELIELEDHLNKQGIELYKLLSLENLNIIVQRHMKTNTDFKEVLKPMLNKYKKFEEFILNEGNKTPY